MVVYTVTEWDRNHLSNRDVEKIVRLGHPVTINSAIRSIQGFNETNSVVILFEHSQYCGYGKLFENTNPGITQYFPPGNISGVSSMIITGGHGASTTPMALKLRLKVKLYLDMVIMTLGFCLPMTRTMYAFKRKGFNSLFVSVKDCEMV